jgi:hypothetical protein
VASERRRTAGLDRSHHATLRTIEVAGIDLAIGRTVAAEDLRHLERGTSHASWFSRPEVACTLSVKCSSGLCVAAMVLVETLT